MMKAVQELRPAAATVVFSLVLACLGSAALAADPGSPYRGRQGKYEFTLQPHYVGSKTIDFGHGTKIDVEDDLGFGFGFGYNFTNNFAMHLDWSWSSSNYKAKIATTDSGGNSTGTTTVGGTLDTATIGLNLSYYILDGPITPFVMGGIGWTYVDSNIPSGPPEGVCWWDPWYGYVCTSYQNTYSDDYFSYTLGIGGRWDVTSNVFLRGAVIWQWLDLDRAGTEVMTGGRLDIGFMF